MCDIVNEISPFSCYVGLTYSKYTLVVEIMKKSGKRIIDQEEENIEMRSDAKKVKKAMTGNVWELFDQGFTVPFLARYRKELTGNMSAEQLRTSFEEFELKK